MLQTGHPSPLPPQLTIAPGLLEQMRQHVDGLAPEEACGLAAGLESEVQLIFPLVNQLHSPTRYRIDPLEQWQAFEAIEKQGLELLAIYHSHPSGPEEPSPTDAAEAFYPEAVYLIWSRAAGNWRCRGFRIVGENVSEMGLNIRDSA